MSLCAGSLDRRKEQITLNLTKASLKQTPQRASRSPVLIVCPVDTELDKGQDAARRGEPVQEAVHDIITLEGG